LQSGGGWVQEVADIRYVTTRQNGNELFRNGILYHVFTHMQHVSE
jgi:hypothetical protein